MREKKTARRQRMRETGRIESDSLCRFLIVSEPTFILFMLRAMSKRASHRHMLSFDAPPSSLYSLVSHPLARPTPVAITCLAHLHKKMPQNKEYIYIR
jgi:hypothetical protein